MNRRCLALTGLVLLALAPAAGAHPVDPLGEADVALEAPDEASRAWLVAATANLVMALTFAGIAWTMWRAIIEGDQFSSNPLLLGMAGIFTFCSISHAVHFEHAMLPVYGPMLGLEAPNLSAEFGMWSRAAMANPFLVAVDVATAGLGVAYFTLRREQRDMFRGAELSEDLRVLEAEARELQDSVVQTSTEALLLLDEGHEEEAAERLEDAIAESKDIVDRFFGEDAGRELGAGDLSLPADPSEG